MGLLKDNLQQVMSKKQLDSSRVSILPKVLLWSEALLQWPIPYHISIGFLQLLVMVVFRLSQRGQHKKNWGPKQGA